LVVDMAQYKRLTSACAACDAYDFLIQIAAQINCGLLLMA